MESLMPKRWVKRSRDAAKLWEMGGESRKERISEE